MTDLRQKVQTAKGADLEKAQKELSDLMAKLGMPQGQGRGQGGPGGPGGFGGGQGRARGGRGGGANSNLTGMEQVELLMKQGVTANGYTEDDRKAAKLPLPPAQDSNVSLLLRPGLLADVEIQVEKLPDVIHVPAQAVFNKNGQYLVFVQGKDGKFEPRPVQLVKQSESMMVIASGVNAGEVVAMADPTPGKDKKSEKKGSGGAQGAMSGMGGGK